MTAPATKTAVTGTDTPAELLIRASNMWVGNRLPPAPTLTDAPPAPTWPTASDIKPVCSPRAALYLRMVASSLASHSPQLVEWCVLAHTAGVVAPFLATPMIIRRGNYQRNVRDYLALVVGLRGRDFAQEVGCTWLQNTQAIGVKRIELEPDDPFATGVKGGRHYTAYIDAYHLWSREVAEKYTEFLMERVLRYSGVNSRFMDVPSNLLKVSTRGPLDMVEAFLDQYSDSSALLTNYNTKQIAHWHRTLNNMHANLAFRKAMHAAFDHHDTEATYG